MLFRDFKYAGISRILGVSLVSSIARTCIFAKRWVRILVLLGLATCGVLAVLFFREYSPAIIILVPESQYDVAANGEEVDVADIKLARHIAVADGMGQNNTTPLHNERQKAVVEMFKHAWNGYKAYAWGKDELLPVSKTGTTNYRMGLTIVDSLDTMWLMGLTEEFKKARDWVADHLNFASIHQQVSVFETNIRILGGLLAAYHLSNDNMFLGKAVSVKALKLL